MPTEEFTDYPSGPGAGYVGVQGVIRVSRGATGLVQSTDGAAPTALGAAGGFGANTTVNLPNNLSANVASLNVQTSLTNNTSGSEASQWVIRLLKGGAQAPGGGFGVDTYTMAPDDFTLNSVTANLHLFSDSGVQRLSAIAALGLYSNQGDIVCHSATSSALATTTQFGFLQITQCAGTPTGVPGRVQGGHTPMIYDTTANKIWFYNGSWRGVVVA